ncbi:TIGR03790 family protein [Opitutus terrae]|uniref:TIGR03790 family protein n=1 Tax=Opitutus terrae (strain DSM 11246 / JCM 15787 / PB90-1) TaxID=452637 RepID=B1ZQR6_OPITP|nr:TIGR03790 family protein [Opitutus terrae]ACB77817.1 hypothetical protein Oter_4546 [Opitutus terrae PB90-1]
MRWFPRLCTLLALLGATAVRGDELAARVVLLANSEDRDSVRVAEHYAEVRGVPRENIVTLPMPLSETISWAEFVRTIWEPLAVELMRARWIDAIPMRLTDAVGRTKRAVSGHRIAYLVVCRGVPLRIAHDPALYEPVLPFTNNSIFRTNAGAVDSELGLLANPGYAINAFVPNALHRNDAPSAFERAAVIKVSRLDGPTVDDALGLVDRAVAAEQTGLLGRAYVDLGGNHPDGDRWLESVVRQLREAGFDLDVDRTPSTLRATARFDAPVLYFGWYAGAVNGPFKLPGFRFPPGAIALHIHSYSAQTLRSAEANWCGPLIARGVTATVGNVFEPYLQLTHRPDLLLRALLRGDTFGDAACYSQPVLSWQAIAIGDPLFRPFARAATDSEPGEVPSQRLAGYAVVREMLALEAAKRPDEALVLARRTQRDQPSFAVGLALAQRLKAAGDESGAADAVGFVPLLDSYRSDEWALAREAANLLRGAGRAPAAIEVFDRLLRSPGMPAGVKSAWLPDAIAAADAAKDLQRAENWRQELRTLEPRRAESAGSPPRQSRPGGRDARVPNGGAAAAEPATPAVRDVEGQRSD